jgi:hypothetical protein
VTLHDYASVCHRNNLVRSDGVYCGLAEPAVCRDCIRECTCTIAGASQPISSARRSASRSRESGSRIETGKSIPPDPGLYRFAKRATASAERGVALIVTHDFGGGVETHIEALSLRLAEAGLAVVYLRTDEPGGFRLGLPGSGGIDSIRATPRSALAVARLAKR